MNAVTAVGGVTIASSDRVRFGSAAVMEAECVTVSAVAREEVDCSSGEQEEPAVSVTGEAESASKETPASAVSEQTRRTASSLCIDEKDYKVVFDSNTRTWMVEWKWAEQQEPETLRNNVTAYSVPEDRRKEYEDEVQRWITEGWLVPCDETEHGKPEGLIPLMRCFKREGER